MFVQLTKWVLGAPGLLQWIVDNWPKEWTNVEVRFMVEEVRLGFQCDDKAIGWFRVWVVDEHLEELVYMEGSNSDDAVPEIGYDSIGFSTEVLEEIFQMARCKRDFERTNEIAFARKYDLHRKNLIKLLE